MATDSLFLNGTVRKAEQSSSKIPSRIPVKLVWQKDHLVFTFPKELVKAYSLGAEWNEVEISRCSGGFTIHVKSKGGLFQ